MPEALTATQNRKLQPAMDNILEHEGEPIPDPSSMETSGSSANRTRPASDAMDEDDEDSEALRAVFGGGSAGVAAAAADVEAKVAYVIVPPS